MRASSSSCVGSIPANLSELRALEKLDLSTNELVGEGQVEGAVVSSPRETVAVLPLVGNTNVIIAKSQSHALKERGA